jgi:D-alanyl-D-alanine carboxypeptidase/D-alanyl-D-alanine-endopeptidase (penicillin-binding protein 4)
MSGRTRALVASGLAVAAIVVLVLAFTGEAVPAPSDAGQVTTPLWSARRVPEPIASAVGAQRLQHALDQSFGGSGVCFVVDADGRPVASHAPDTPLIPASTQKLLVGAAALAILGDGFTYETRVTAPAASSNGSVDRLYLVGAGDPELATAAYASYLDGKGDTHGTVVTSVDALADAIVAKGIRRVPGGIVTDDSRYDAQRYVPTWSTGYRGSDIGPMGALVVNGSLSSWKPRKVAAADPALSAGTALAQALAARGVQVGAVTRGPAPADAPLVASAQSSPLRQIVTNMLSSSDNLAAELLVKELAVHAGRPGTTADGTAVVLAELHSLGIPTEQVTMVDGSGLDRGDRLSCRALTAVLSFGTRPGMAPLLDGLPVAAQTGTLFDQFTGTPLAGKLRAKTGTLDGVSGFAGVVDVGGNLQFAFLDNGNFPEAAADGVRTRLGGILATYPDAPPVEALVPAPAAPSSLHPAGGH